MNATKTVSSSSTESLIEFPSSTSNRTEIEWMTLDDGHEALLVNGGGIDGGDGTYFAIAARTCTRSGSWTRSSPVTSAS